MIFLLIVFALVALGVLLFFIRSVDHDSKVKAVVAFALFIAIVVTGGLLAEKTGIL